MRAFLKFLGAAAVISGCMGHDGLPINPMLAVPGFPDCTNPKLAAKSPLATAINELVCTQRGRAEQVKIGTVGDSITAGVHSTGGNHTYPGQLQLMLDASFPGKFAVTNLGACGSTMLKKSNSPYWERPQFTALKGGTWDIIIIMLGTNDAKDTQSHGPNNWLHNCGGADHTTLEGCTFAQDYLSMIDLIKTLGRTPAGPKIFTAIPPPLMQLDSIGANQVVINSVYPKLIPMINTAAKVDTAVIDVFAAMGGTSDWNQTFPKSCTLSTAKTYTPCAWWCDEQSCDQCHPNNDGYTRLASAMFGGLGVGDGCKSTEYCCPDAQHCLTPTKTSCKDDPSVCGSNTCCPLTKLCVVVGNPCSTPCLDQGSYCCPDAKACLMPTNPGVFCNSTSPCASGQVCCPLTSICVKPGATCTP
mmetsp:Transcript_24202/g.63195  ORF Transcript_24202/g.63195 Transcript_24202/m.63195 type:complete len:415 (-) Transcript_24202:150-1394(-)|eukprot:CAMPEP_0182924802 /NCGR_PEP_ID=MMETSP0105_2-20130417/7508_1 /TAXON_ID=81532 ORGANISM="Acanthoeca-like sp., Strain 10tr" /NCGR_SAMPLE_ID=MMETSP0105_2 /ASSEMBLY_ACC=CAM_ASM_000205 /LENGTH=414 /DNA_ID=CAMNT_0025062609 /DNA_START=81 /DNA_END=1325 /DNA_ORIENTATION=+